MATPDGFGGRVSTLDADIVINSLAFYTVNVSDYLVIAGTTISGEDLTFPLNNVNINLEPQQAGRVRFSYAPAIAQYSVPYFGLNGTLESTAALTNGQILIGKTAGVPVPATITAGAGISVVTGANSITIAAIGGGAGVTAFTTDGGNVIPALGIVDEVGGDNITTAGAGNVLTISVSGTTDHTVQVGNAAGSLTSIAAGTTGQLLIGATGADPAFGTTAYGNFTFSNVTPATDTTFAVTNGDGDPASDAQILIGLSAGAGDPSINFQISATTNYAIGIDNSDSDEFKLTNSTSPSAGTELVAITNAGVITLANDLDVSEGGTGVSTLTSHGILMGNGAGDIQATAEPANGELLIGSTGNQPVLATLASAGGTVTITVGAGTINLEASVGGGGLIWEEVTDAAKAGAINHGYICNRGTLVTVTLPSTAAIGSVISIVGKGAGLWRIAQNAGESIIFGSETSTGGVGGYLAATLLNDCAEIVCTTADTVWTVRSSIGNLTVN